MNPGPSTQLERLRCAELALVSRWFEPGTHILELGAGSGYQASLLAARGCEVTALDLPGRVQTDRAHYAVQEYDGRTIPVEDETIDVVFSSHVLEHVQSLPPLLAETRRVMKPTALSIHILPTSTWRVWTSLAHYPFVLKMLIAGPTADPLVTVTSTEAAIRRYGIARAAYKTLVHPFVPHGIRRNAFEEVCAFSERTWRAVFKKNGFSIIAALPTRLFYTGYGILPELTIELRSCLSSFLGSSSRAFVMRKHDPARSFYERDA